MRNFSIDFDRLFNEIEIGIFINDTEGNIISYNPKAKELFLSAFGKSSINEVTSEISLGKLLIQAKKYFTSGDIPTNRKPVYNRKVKYIDENNNVVWFIVNSLPIINADGEISEIFNIITNLNDVSSFEDPVKDAAKNIERDITDRRVVEEKLKELNAKLIEANRIISVERDKAKNQVNVLEEVNRLKSDFISNISHELRTPLASIVGFSETISGDPNLPRETVVEFNNIILSEGKRLARLINDFLDFAKIEAGKMDLNKSVFNISELLPEIIGKIKPLADEKGVIFTSEIPDKEIILFSDRERIGQVFYQLISNAIKFTKPGGKVTLTGQDFLKEIEFIITDTGIGISEQDQKNIFQKFFKVENPGTINTGTGIGLGLAKQIIDLHHGLISFQSEVNKGTTFVVRLPKMTQTKI